MGLGIALGSAIGLVFGNIGLGISLGLLLGVVFANYKKNNSKKEK